MVIAGYTPAAWAAGMLCPPGMVLTLGSAAPECVCADDTQVWNTVLPSTNPTTAVFSPQQIDGLVFWYLPDYVEASGTTLTAWNNMGAAAGLGRLTPLGTSPTLTAMGNGVSTLVPTMTTTRGTANTSVDASVLGSFTVVAAVLPATTATNILSTFPTTASVIPGYALDLWRNGTAATARVIYGDGSVANTVSTNSTVAANAGALVWVHTIQQTGSIAATSTQTLWSPASIPQTTSGSTPSSVKAPVFILPGGSQGLAIGSRATSALSQTNTVYIPELLVYTRALSVREQTAVGAYMARRWQPNAMPAYVGCTLSQ